MYNNYILKKDNTTCNIEGMEARQKYKYSKKEKKHIHSSGFMFRSYAVKCISGIIAFITLAVFTLGFSGGLLRSPKYVYETAPVGFVIVIILSLTASCIIAMIVYRYLKRFLYSKWWRCPSCGYPLPSRYLLRDDTVWKQNIEPIYTCSHCNTRIPKTIREARKSEASIEELKDKIIWDVQSESEPKKAYNWGINRTIFAYIVDPYDSNGELSDDGLDWVQRDTMPCIQSLFHFLFDYSLIPVYTKKPNQTDTKTVGKALLKFQFPNETFYLFMEPTYAQKLQKLIVEYHDEDIIVTEEKVGYF